MERYALRAIQARAVTMLLGAGLAFGRNAIVAEHSSGEQQDTSSTKILAKIGPFASRTWPRGQKASLTGHRPGFMVGRIAIIRPTFTRKNRASADSVRRDTIGLIISKSREVR